jgi:hypothetical protein
MEAGINRVVIVMPASCGSAALRSSASETLCLRVPATNPDKNAYLQNYSRSNPGNICFYPGRRIAGWNPYDICSFE